MKRMPLLLTLLALVALSASIAYWVLQLYKPEQRPIAAAPVAALPEPAVDAAATLFGGQAMAAVATNYQLTGVVAAGRNSVAILVADGQPAKAFPVGKELSAGVVVKEVYPRYVMLSTWQSMSNRPPTWPRRCRWMRQHRRRIRSRGSRCRNSSRCRRRRRPRPRQRSSRAHCRSPSRRRNSSRNNRSRMSPRKGRKGNRHRRYRWPGRLKVRLLRSLRQHRRCRCRRRRATLVCRDRLR